MAYQKRARPTVSPNGYKVIVDDGAEHYFLTDGPASHETTIPYYKAMAEICRRYFGRAVSRNTMYKYLSTGFPVRKGGPYVHLPTENRLSRRVTTEQAMERWMTVVRHLQKKHA